MAEERWVTINGRHVLIGADGVAEFNESVKERQLKQAQAERERLNNKSDNAKQTATRETQAQHKKAIQELNSDEYEDGTYDIKTKQSKTFPDGYQVTFCQIGDDYSDDDYAKKVNECLKMSSDGKTYAGKFGGTPEISFHCKSKEQAIAYAKANNQISIWDWAADNGEGAEIDCGGSGDRHKTRAQVEAEWAKAAAEEEAKKKK